MNKDWIRKLVEQKEAKEEATKEHKLRRESQLTKQQTDNIEKWEISTREVILPLLEEYSAEFRKMGYEWNSYSSSPTTIARTKKQRFSKITLKASNAKPTAHSHQIISPSIEFTLSPDYSAVNISVVPRTIGIPETSIPMDSITKQSLEDTINIFIETIFT